VVVTDYLATQRSNFNTDGLLEVLRSIDQGTCLAQFRSLWLPPCRKLVESCPDLCTGRADVCTVGNSECCLSRLGSYSHETQI